MYDLDGMTFGDCEPNGSIDDFWTFFDGNFDGRADPCDPNDAVLQASDGLADGIIQNPWCDLMSTDSFQSHSLLFYHAYTLLVFNFDFGVGGASVDVVRGNVENLSWGPSDVHLGPLGCVKDNGTVQTGPYFVVNDLELPPPGAAWFYVAKVNLPGPPRSYEYSYGFSQCLPRSAPAADGGCAP